MATRSWWRSPSRRAQPAGRIQRSASRTEAILMPRPATGQVIERTGKRGGAPALRLTRRGAHRRQVRLGSDAPAWTRRRAEEQLQAVLADLRRGRPNEI